MACPKRRYKRHFWTRSSLHFDSSVEEQTPEVAESGTSAAGGGDTLDGVRRAGVAGQLFFTPSGGAATVEDAGAAVPESASVARLVASSGHFVQGNVPSAVSHVPSRYRQRLTADGCWPSISDKPISRQVCPPAPVADLAAADATARRAARIAARRAARAAASRVWAVDTAGTEELLAESDSGPANDAEGASVRNAAAAGPGVWGCPSEQPAAPHCSCQAPRTRAHGPRRQSFGVSEAVLPLISKMHRTLL